MSDFRRRLMMMQKAQPSFPAELQRCEYIYTLGGAYIDTRVNANSEIYLELDMMLSENENACIIGARGDSSPYCDLYHQRADFFWQYGTSTPHRVLGLSRRYITIDRNNFKSVSGGVEYSISADYSQFNINKNMFLFAMNKNSDYRFSRKLVVFSLKMKENATQTSFSRDFIPCYVKDGKTFIDVKGNTCPAGIVGMYDTINGDFYTNDGSGTFAKGADI